MAAQTLHRQLPKRQPSMHLIIPDRKNVNYSQDSPSGAASPAVSVDGSDGNLTPDIGPSLNTPPVFPTQTSPPVPQTQQQTDNTECSEATPIDSPPYPDVTKIGPYILAKQLQSLSHISIYSAFHTRTYKEYVCKVIPLSRFHDAISPYYLVGSHDHINQIEEIIQGKTNAYVFFGQSYGDLHSYISKSKKRPREAEVSRLILQIVDVLSHCHQNGIILRDIKLRKFTFRDPEQTHLTLIGLEDAYILPDPSDDTMQDKHGCPAYVSPELLNPGHPYSGKASDVWSVGIMLYTMLIGRYPFHDRDPPTLFMKIKRGDFSIPDTVSSRGKCLIRSLLRQDPADRLTAEEIPKHPWFRNQSRLLAISKNVNNGSSNSGNKQTSAESVTVSDQIVPSFVQGDGGVGSDGVFFTL